MLPQDVQISVTMYIPLSILTFLPPNKSFFFYTYNRRQISAKPIVKKHYSKGKAYWCTPRKVKSIDSTEKVDNSLVNIVKPKKGKSKVRDIVVLLLQLVN